MSAKDEGSSGRRNMSAKIRFYGFKDLLTSVQKLRRTDVALSGRRHKNYIWNIIGQKVKNETSDLSSWQDDHKHQLCLEKLLRDKKYLAAFRSYLQSEFSEENVEFWLACEDFKTTASPEDLRWKAEQIYEEFIKPTACREINVDHLVREKIQRSLEKPNYSCFDEAQKHVYLLMQRDTCPRFLHSDAYLSLKRKPRTVWYI